MASLLKFDGDLYLVCKKMAQAVNRNHIQLHRLTNSPGFAVSAKTSLSLSLLSVNLRSFPDGGHKLVCQTFDRLKTAEHIPLTKTDLYRVSIFHVIFR
jgi:hypothetical protein